MKGAPNRKNWRACEKRRGTRGAFRLAGKGKKRRSYKPNVRNKN